MAYGCKVIQIITKCITIHEIIFFYFFSTRDELCNLIERLKGNEKIGPSLVGIVDEDSSSINSVNSKNDGEENVMLDSENHIKDGKKNHIECDESNKNENDNASDITCAENDVKKDDNVSLMKNNFGFPNFC